MDYDQFKAKVLKLFETNTESSAYKACHELIPEIELSEEEKQELAQSAEAAAEAPFTKGDAKYWLNEMTKVGQELRFNCWMASLKDDFNKIRKQKEAKARATWQAAWEAKTPEEKAAYLEEERKFKEKCHAATTAALDRYYEEAARTGSYSGD